MLTTSAASIAAPVRPHGQSLPCRSHRGWPCPRRVRLVHRTTGT